MMNFKAWTRVIIKEEFEVVGNSYIEALLLAKKTSEAHKEFYDSNGQVIGIEYGVTPLSMEESHD